MKISVRVSGANDGLARRLAHIAALRLEQTRLGQNRTTNNSTQTAPTPKDPTEITSPPIEQEPLS
ncbi:MAG: hypothetical protein ABL898_19135 [Hyphomicrobiaceae bacterium]